MSKQPRRKIRRPVIGVTMACTAPSAARPPGYRVNMEYMSAVELAGAVPLAIGYHMAPGSIPSLIDAVDGVVFTGGDDLDPALYGRGRHPKAVAIDPFRQAFELALLAEVEKRQLPALFICLGCQLLNVYRGGSLLQFIPDLPGKLEHRRLDLPMRYHEVTFQGESLLRAAIGKKRLQTNTYHKQAIDRLGRGLRVVATADDGIIEAIADPDFPQMAAVQWHPERLCDRKEHLAIFKLLVEMAKGRRQ